MILTLLERPSHCPVCGSFAITSIGPTLSWCERQACFYSWNPELLDDTSADDEDPAPS